MKRLPFETAIRHVRKQVLSASPIAPVSFVQLCTYPSGLASDYRTTGNSAHAILVLAGRMSFGERGREMLELSAGTALLLPARCVKRWSVERETVMFQAIVDGDLRMSSCGLLGTLFSPLRPHLETFDVGMDLTREVEARLNLTTPSLIKDVNHSVTAFLLMEAMLQVAQSGENASLSREHSAVVRCVSYIERNIQRELTLAELSKISCLGVSRLSELFRQSMGMSPMKYVRKRKAEIAERMLANGDIAAVKTAAQLGFHSASYFSRFMKRQAGRLPSEIVDS